MNINSCQYFLDKIKYFITFIKQRLNIEDKNTGKELLIWYKDNSKLTGKMNSNNRHEVHIVMKIITTY